MTAIRTHQSKNGNPRWASYPSLYACAEAAAIPLDDIAGILYHEISRAVRRCANPNRTNCPDPLSGTGQTQLDLNTDVILEAKDDVKNVGQDHPCPPSPTGTPETSADPTPIFSAEQPIEQPLDPPRPEWRPLAPCLLAALRAILPRLNRGHHRFFSSQLTQSEDAGCCERSIWTGLGMLRKVGAARALAGQELYSGDGPHRAAQRDHEWRSPRITPTYDVAGLWRYIPNWLRQLLLDAYERAYGARSLLPSLQYLGQRPGGEADSVSVGSNDVASEEKTPNGFREKRSAENDGRNLSSPAPAGEAFPVQELAGRIESPGKGRNEAAPADDGRLPRRTRSEPPADPVLDAILAADPFAETHEAETHEAETPEEAAARVAREELERKQRETRQARAWLRTTGIQDPSLGRMVTSMGHEWCRRAALFHQFKALVGEQIGARYLVGVWKTWITEGKEPLDLEGWSDTRFFDYVKRGEQPAKGTARADFRADSRAINPTRSAPAKPGTAKGAVDPGLKTAPAGTSPGTTSTSSTMPPPPSLPLAQQPVERLVERPAERPNSDRGRAKALESLRRLGIGRKLRRSNASGEASSSEREVPHNREGDRGGHYGP